jgi:hypothetical protein
MGIPMKNKEQQIVESLKRQRDEILNSPRLSNLVNLYSAVIDIHERRWAEDNGIITKSKPVDLKPLIDAWALQYKENEDKLKFLDNPNCEDCTPQEEEKDTRNIKINKLKWIVLED